MKKTIIQALRSVIDIIAQYADYTGIYNTEAIKTALSDDSILNSILESIKSLPLTKRLNVMLKRFEVDGVTSSPMLGFRKTFLDGQISKVVTPLLADDDIQSNNTEFQLQKETGKVKITLEEEVVVTSSNAIPNSSYPVLRFLAARVASDFGSRTDDTNIEMGARYLQVNPDIAKSVGEGDSTSSDSSLNDLMTRGKTTKGGDLLDQLKK